MSQVANYTTEIASSNLTMGALKIAIENLVLAAASCNSGATAPNNPFAGMIWRDTSASPTITLRQYSNTFGWVPLMSYNDTTGALLSIGGRALGGAGTGDIPTLSSVGTFTNKRHTSPKINEDVALTATSTDLEQLKGKTAVNTADNQTVGGTKNFSGTLQIGGTAHATHSGDVTGGAALTIAAAAVNTTKLKTVANTTGASGTLSIGGTVNIVMQDFCFFPNIYAASVDIIFRPIGTNNADTTARFILHNSSAVGTAGYHARWRYVTATDEPFIYALRDARSGEVLHLWACDDPPPGYWGLNERPAGFVAPLIVSPAPLDMEEIVLFKTNKQFVIELGEKATRDKLLPFQVLDRNYEFDKGSKTFRSKNLAEI